MKAKPALEFPDWEAAWPPPAPMTSEQYDRFLEETLRRDGEAIRRPYLPVPAPFVLVKEDGPVKNESSGTKR